MEPRPEDRRTNYSDGLLDRGVEGVVRHRFRRLGDLAVLRGHLSAVQLEQLFAELGIAGILRESPPLDQLVLERKWMSPETVTELKEELDGRDFARVSTTAPTGPPPEVLYVLADPERNFYHYALVNELAQSDHGKVWKAWDCNTQRWVQLKVLAPTVPAPARLEFVREADVLRSITSKNLVTVLEGGEFKGRPYLATELVEGRPLDLNDRLQQTISTLAAAADGLHLAHQKGALHRRLHPGCLIGSAPVVVDFGAPHLVSAERGRQDAARFVAPELAGGKLDALSPATDVYGLGLMLYEAIERRPAFQAENPAALLQKIVTKDPPPPAAPKALRAVCMKAIARDPARRYASAGVFAAELRKAGADTEITRVRRVPRSFPWTAVVASLVLLAGGGAGGWTYLQWRKSEEERAARVQRLREAVDAARRAVDPIRGTAASADRIEAAAAALEALARTARDCGFPEDPEALAVSGAGWYWAGDRERAGAILSKGAIAGSAWPEPAWLRTLLAVEDAALARAVGGSLEGFDPEPGVLQAVANAVEAARTIPPEWASARPGASALLGALAEAQEGRREEAARKAEVEGAGPEALLLAAALRPDAPVSLCDRVLERRPGYAPALVLKARRQASAGDLPAAESTAATAVAAVPRLSPARTVRGSILRALGREAEALEEFGAAIRATGAPFEGFLARGDVRRAKREWEAAIQDYAEALNLQPRRVEVLWRLGLSWQGRGEPAKALEQFDRALAIAPDDVACLLARGALRRLEGELDRALEDLDRAAAKDPRNAEVRLERGRVRRRLRQEKPALQDFEEALRLDPKLAEACYELANLHENAGNAEAALPMYDQAIRLRPGWPEALASRGITHFRREGFESALADFEAALRFAPQNWPQRAAVENFRDQAIKKLEK